ncbi:cytochrome b [Pelagibacterium luteolum]|uniref:Cytochrome b n=1 Tax=Pelagibacterium luteolum TaxID=440168 RepID=A0A1G7USY4_9HYPH|nr:cytochrome b N-terminal domain-containing protein [Pelagibacterium luteolum]SDG50381.1 ubiquinol-cytochrome c reductase cytochrome b subunit [Pelagibacterium luteolum]
MANHAGNYTPGSGFERWLDDRLPIVRFSKEHLMDFPTPKNLNYWWTFGGILAFMLVVQIVTGIILVMHYTPHVDLAFASVEHIRRDVNYGRIIQGTHAVGASMFFAAIYVHIFRGMYYGSYKAPREIIWMLGVVLFILVMATAFMGYVLPWGQMSLWGATVITGIFSAVPLVGEAIQTMLLGGFSVANPTLNRFFSLHYLLPFIVAAVVVLHIWALHVPGNNNPTGVEVKESRDTLPFHPYYTMKDLFAIIVFLIPFAWFVFFAPDILGHADNYIPANPQVTPSHIVPEWYLLPFYTMLRAIDFNVLFIDSKLGGVIVMAGSLLILFALPWLDTSKVRAGTFRPLFKPFYWLFVVNFIALAYLGAQPAEGIYTVLGKITTAYYFAYFLIILPLLGRIEKPAPLPVSISESVLGKAKG